MEKKYLLIIAVMFGFSTTCFGVDIVYPKNKNVTINSPKTFFVGNENINKTLFINGQNIKLHPTGGFKYPVNLNYGLNKFTIDNGEEQIIYNITRPLPKNINSAAEQRKINYDNNIVIEIIKDSTPLRATPVDAGLNRLQHLQKGIKFEATGEERNFYRVKLGRDDFGFISKDFARQISDVNIEKADVLNKIIKCNCGEQRMEIQLDKQVPYAISETGSGLDIVVYGINNTPFEKLEEHIETKGKVFGYKSEYSENTLVITAKKFPKTNHEKPLEDLKITIDPGHGGNELGAVGCLGTKEKDVNLQIAQNLKNKLTEAGATVFMTREDDSFVPLNDRVTKTNENNSDIFVSIHNNSLPDSLADKDASGTETYYFYPQSKKLAQKLSKSISKETGFNDGGAKGQSFAVIRNMQCPAVLLEIGYMINPDDNSKLIDKDFQNKITDGILHGLENYINDIQ